MSKAPPMDLGGLLSAARALPRRPVADRGAFLWSVLIATLATTVIAGCSATWIRVRPTTLIQTRWQARRRRLDKPLLLPVSRAMLHRRLQPRRITATRRLTRNSHSPICFTAQRRRKPRVKPKLCHIRPAPTHLPASLTRRLRASSPIAHPRHLLRPAPPCRPPIQIPPTRCRTPNNRLSIFSRTNSPLILKAMFLAQAACAFAKGRPSSISRLTRCTVALPTPSPTAIFRTPLPVRNWLWMRFSRAGSRPPKLLTRCFCPLKPGVHPLSDHAALLVSHPVTAKRLAGRNLTSASVRSAERLWDLGPP